MLGEQMACCKACRVRINMEPHTPTSCVVDHDHSKKKGDIGFVRGLICQDCNVALGHLRDKLDRCLALAAYIKGFVHA